MTIRPPFARKYAETLGRVYTDTSRWIRYVGFIRGLFLRGQQLWDDDVNRSLANWGRYHPQTAIHRKYLNIIAPPPYYSPFLAVNVMDPKHYFQDTTGWPEEDHIYFWARGMNDSIEWRPLPGLLCYVKADRNVVAFTGSEWKPALKFEDRNMTVEIAIFASKGATKRGKVMAAYTVDRKFELLRINRESRARGIYVNSGAGGGFQIRKNGVKVGIVWQNKYSSGITMQADTIFSPGDTLDIFVDDIAQWVDPVSITLVGKLRYD